MDVLERKHAVLSASGAHKWFNCTLSARREELMPAEETVYAEEGTVAHKMAEAAARADLSEIAIAYEEAKAKGFDADEMQQAVTEYREFIVDNFVPGSELLTEHRVDFSHIVPEGFGTCDAVILDRVRGFAVIIDFKYGKGVKVDAENNPQLTLYALGVLDSYTTVNTIKMAIVQPRIGHISIVKTNRDSLSKIAEDIKEKALKAFKGEGEATPGEWCRFCRARGGCKERAETVAEPIVKSEIICAEFMNNDEVGKWLDMGAPFISWYEDLKKEATRRLMDGESVPGYKMVEGKGSRTWTDEEEAITTIKNNGIAEALLYDKKLKTLPQIEKVVGKKELERIAGHLVIRKPGAPTIAPESDPREALEVVDTQSLFSEIGG